MSKEKCYVGFIGAGGIARSHAFALNSLRYYYNDAPETDLVAVCSKSEKSRNDFSIRYGFRKPVSIEEFAANDLIDTVFIMGPNNVHYEHLKAALSMPKTARIYIEKPLCSTIEEEGLIAGLAAEHPGIKIQTGYQFLFMSSVREALIFWKTGVLGKPLHFDLKYYHGDYLKKEYRDKRTSRLTPAPDGGAMADLGSHAVSLAVAFLGDGLKIIGAIQAGQFEDVIPESDLYSLITMFDQRTRAAGTISASRISSGTGDMLSMEFYCERGVLRLSSQSADYFEYFLEEKGQWCRKMTGSNYKPLTSFPSGHVPPGWLRAMIHGHYVFLTSGDTETIVPDIKHGLAVQRVVRETSMFLENFRKQDKKEDYLRK